MIMKLSNELKKLGWSKELIDAVGRVSSFVAKSTVPINSSVGEIFIKRNCSDSLKINLSDKRDAASTMCRVKFSQHS